MSNVYVHYHDRGSSLALGQVPLAVLGEALLADGDLCLISMVHGLEASVRVTWLEAVKAGYGRRTKDTMGMVIVVAR